MTSSTVGYQTVMGAYLSAPYTIVSNMKKVPGYKGLQDPIGFSTSPPHPLETLTLS
jgi:hypothetical protein